LDLHPDKTRLIEFGRFAVQRRSSKGLSKPETFDFLGFTHICAKTEEGRFLVVRQTMRKRMQAKLVEIKETLYRTLPVCGFRRNQPSIPTETSHLFRLKPAGNSD
jgi:hypothetical protein